MPKKEIAPGLGIPLFAHPSGADPELSALVGPSLSQPFSRKVPFVLDRLGLVVGPSSTFSNQSRPDSFSLICQQHHSAQSLFQSLAALSLAGQHVWSLTQFFSVDFSQSRISVKKCVFNKRTINVCVN